MVDQPNPLIPAHPARLAHPLVNLTQQLKGDAPIKIVALGSSSTAGKWPVIAYPFRLEQKLREQYKDNHDKTKDRLINVLNRGIGGEEARIERNRLERDVIAEQPALLIWQVGTNAAWKGDDLTDVDKAIREGLELLRQEPMDVVLMDPQYAPALLIPDTTRRAAEQVVTLIAEAAANASRPVSVFQRFRLMRAWHDHERVSFDSLVDPDDEARLHQSDWSTRRVAAALCEAIAEAVDRATGA